LGYSLLHAGINHTVAKLNSEIRRKLTSHERCSCRTAVGCSVQVFEAC